MPFSVNNAARLIFYFSDLRQENFMDSPGTFKYQYGWEYNYKLAGSSFDAIKRNRLLQKSISSLQYRVSAREVDQFRIFFHQVRKISPNFRPWRPERTEKSSVMTIILLKY